MVSKVDFVLLALVLPPVFVVGSQQEESKEWFEQRCFGRRVAFELTQLEFNIVTTMSKLQILKKFFPPYEGEAPSLTVEDDLEVLRQYARTLMRLSDMRKEVHRLSDSFKKDGNGKSPSVSELDLLARAKVDGAEPH